jgi:hypothetical protein
MRKKGRRGRSSRRASNRRVIARETREVSTAARTLVSSRRSTNRHPRREALVKKDWSVTVFSASSSSTSAPASISLFSVSVGRERLAVLEGRFSRGARRSDGATLIDHPDLLVYACRHVGDHRDVVRRVRPRSRGALDAPMSFRHDVPYIDRHVHRRRAHDDRTPVAHAFVGRAPSRSPSSSPGTTLTNPLRDHRRRRLCGGRVRLPSATTANAEKKISPRSQPPSILVSTLPSSSPGSNPTSTRAPVAFLEETRSAGRRAAVFLSRVFPH